MTFTNHLTEEDLGSITVVKEVECQECETRTIGYYFNAADRHAEETNALFGSGIEADAAAHARSNAAVGRPDEAQYVTEEFLNELEGEMLAAADALEFERAAALRDRIDQLRQQIGKRTDEVELEHSTRQGRGKRRKRGGRRGVPKPEKP